MVAQPVAAVVTGDGRDGRDERDQADKAVGVVSDEELLTGYRRFARLEGHPTPVLPWVDVATGSLGQGLPNGVGVALAGRYLDELPYRVWVLCGDSETAEGSMWEALDKAGYYQLAQPDRTRRRQSAGPARRDRIRLGPRRVRQRVESFGCFPIVIDGHEVTAIDTRLRAGAVATGLP